MRTKFGTWIFLVLPLRSEIPFLLSAADYKSISICTLQLHHPYDHHDLSHHYDHHTRTLPSSERKVHLIEEEHHPLQDKERPNTSLNLTFSSQGATSFQFSQCMLVFCQLEEQLILYPSKCKLGFHPLKLEPVSPVSCAFILSVPPT